MELRGAATSRGAARALLAAAAVAAAAACATIPEEPAPLEVPPGLVWSCAVEPGAVLTGWTATDPQPSDDIFRVHLEVLADDTPGSAETGELESLAAHAVLVRTPGRARALEPALMIGTDVGMARGDAAEALLLASATSLRLLDVVRELPSGAMLELVLESPEPPPPPPYVPGGVRDRGTAPQPEPQPGPVRERFTLRLGREPRGVRVALHLPTREPFELPELGTTEPPTARSASTRGEWILLDGELSIGDTFALRVPRPVPWDGTATMVVGVRLVAEALEPVASVAPGSRFVEHTPQAQGRTPWESQLAASLGALRDVTRSGALRDATELGALRDATRLGTPRAALAHLGAETGAATWLDLVLGADEAQLAGLASALLKSADDAEVPDRETLAWELDRIALRSLIERIKAREADDPAAVALLGACTGEAAAFPTLLGDALANHTNRAAFDAWIVDENRLFLSDRSPAARVRAYDWLAARGLAPEGFDPFANEEERRASLEASAQRDGEQL